MRKESTVSAAASIRNLDFVFENSIVKIIANRNLAEIELGGLRVGPFEEGNEYDVYYWVAAELEKSEIVHFPESDRLDASKLNKTQWTERIQVPGQISKLPESFYPKLRRCIAQMKEEILKDPQRVKDYDRIRHLAQDIVNSRVRKIVSMASTTAQTENVLRNLTEEEKDLYERLYTLINEWRTGISIYQEAAK